MLARSLPMVSLESGHEFGQMLEAFALTYLARYASEAPVARVDTAYKRAWGMAHLAMFPRVPGGRPGFVLARYTQNNWTRLIVAIEGMQTLNQVVNIWPGQAAVVPNGLQGRVCALWNTYADQILATLAAQSGDWTTWVGEPMTTITFAGHSLGAACAELCAFKHRLTHLNQQVHVWKFGSPKVGTSAWYNNRDRGVRVRSIYAGSDPMRLVPGRLIRSFFETSLWPDQLTRTYIFPPEPGIECFTHSGEPSRSDFLEEFFSPADVYRAALRTPVNVQHPYWFHQPDYYRVMFMRVAASQNDLLKARMNYLEHNDENNWQIHWQPAGVDFIPQHVILAPAPVDYDFQTAYEQRQFHTGIAPPVQPPLAAEVGEGGGVFGGDWRGVPITTSVARRQRVR